jgi:hypothetical protein
MTRKIALVCFMLSAVFLLVHCSSSKLKGQPGDGQEDTDADPGSDALPDVSDDDAPADPAVDDGLDEPLQHCSGTDTLTLRYVDPDANPMPGLDVALTCLDDRQEGVTDEDGRIEFVNLDLAGFPVAVTAVGENFAYTLTDIGGSRPVPEVLQMPLTVMSWLAAPGGHDLQGPIVHSQPGSWVMVSVPTYQEIFNGDRYSLVFSPEGTRIPMSALEFSLEGNTATPIGFSFQRYDSPPEGEDGPSVVPEPAEFERAQVTVSYDVGPDSPLNMPDWEDFRREQEGVHMRAFDANESSWRVGITTTWTRGETQDTLDFAWVPADLSEAARTEAYVQLTSVYSGYLAYAFLRGEPSTWTAVTVHDPPDLVDRESLDIVPFEVELLVNVPARVDLVRYQVHSFGLDSENIWFIERPPENDTLELSAFPWPTTASQMEFLYYDPDNLPYMWIQGMAYDVDPFENYEHWVDPAWDAEHYLSMAMTQWIDVDLPK